MGKFPLDGTVGTARPGLLRLLAAATAAGLLLAPVTARAAPAGATAAAPGPARAPGPALVPGSTSDGLGGSVAVSGNYALIGAAGVNNAAGAAYIYVRQGSRWGLQAVLTDPADYPGDFFGFGVALSGSTAMVSDGRTRTYVYTLSAGKWRLTQRISGVGELALTASVAVVALSPDVLVYVRSGTHWVRQATLSAPPGFNDEFGCNVAVSGATVVVTGCQIGVPGSVPAVFVYQRSGVQWQLQATLGNPRSDDDNFGSATAVSGATIMVGAEGDGSTFSSVFVYTRTGSSWTLQSPLANAPASFFGSAIALSGTTAVVGAPGVGPGTDYVYTLVAGQWQLQGQLPAPSRPGQVFFGAPLAIAGGTVVAGATGAAYPYVRSGSGWKRQGQMTDPYSRPGADKGAAVAISGSVAAVGAWGADGQQGAVYVYAKSHGRWGLQATLTNPGRDAVWFGSAVGVSGSTVIVGAWGENGLVGVVYVYVRSGTRWHLQARLADPRSAAQGGGGFGGAIAISGSTAVIGASNSEVQGTPGGGVSYVYRRSGTRWRDQAVLPDPADRVDDEFGEAISLSGNSVLIGASGENIEAGAAYVYSWSGSKWQLKGTLADPAGQPNDSFGTSVALSGATAVIGAPGVSDFTGAAYVYGRLGSGWHRLATLTIPRAVNVAGGFGSAGAVAGTGRNLAVLLSGESVSGLTLARKRCGSIFEFGHPAGRWHEIERVADPDCTSYDEFGYALSISGTTALIGAPGAGGDSGTAYIQSLKKP